MSERGRLCLGTDWCILRSSGEDIFCIAKALDMDMGVWEDLSSFEDPTQSESIDDSRIVEYTYSGSMARIRYPFFNMRSMFYHHYHVSLRFS